MSTAYMPKSKSQEYGTPKSFFDRIDKIYKFTLDAAASDDNALCEKYYTKEQNGLLHSWKGETVWINPPFAVKDLSAFASKAYNESRDVNTRVIMLVPVKSDQDWWHRYAIKSDIYFIKGRMQFVNTNGNFPGPLALLSFSQWSDGEIGSMTRDGDIIY